MARERIATWPSADASRVSTRTETLAGDRVITAAELDRYQVWFLDPGGAGRNVDLPAEAGAEGAWVVIANTADNPEVLTVRNDAAATIATPAQNETATFYCDGTTWVGQVGASS